MASSESEPEFEVKEVLKQRKRKGLVEYLVRWNGYNDSDDDTWEPAASLTNCIDQLKKFVQAQEQAKKEKKRTSRARSKSKSRGRSRSRARSKSASRKSDKKKKTVSKSEQSVVKSVSKDETSISKIEGNSKVLSSDEENDEPLPSRRLMSTRQSRRSEVITTRQVTATSDIVDGNITKITRLLGERRETLENHRKPEMNITKATSKSGFWADLWNNMDTAVLILFICISVIIFSFVLEKYISSDDISASIAKIYKKSSENIQNWWKILCAAIYSAWNTCVLFVKSNWKKISAK